MATHSFHETKNISTGEGGALLINDPQYIERAEIIREKGTNRSRFFRGAVDKYTWVDIGSSYLPSEMVTAMLLAQLEARDRIQARRIKVWSTYFQELSGWAENAGVQLPHVPDYCEHPGHLFYLLMPTLDVRTRFLDWMKSQEILCVFHYLPLHLSKMGLQLGGRPGDCPVTEDISDRLVRLPLFYDITDDEVAQVLNSVKSFEF